MQNLQFVATSPALCGILNVQIASTTQQPAVWIKQALKLPQTSCYRCNELRGKPKHMSSKVQTA
jgi:hypothetical protein